MALGFLGILVILGPDQGIPLPQNTGDWMALTSGFLWAAGSLLLLLDEQGTAFDCGIGFIFWGTVCAAAMAILAIQLGDLPPPRLTVDLDLLSWLVPVSILIVIPAGFATVYGPMVLNPGVVGLLFMTEITVGTITAAVWAGEPFGFIQILGILLVSSAGLLEVLWLAMTQKPGKRALTR